MLQELPWIIIPVTLIVLAVGPAIAETVMQTFERIQLARLQARQSSSGASDDKIAQLEEQIALLRDTSTQHAISLQHAMERLEQRVDFIERKTSATVEPVVDAAPRQQVIGRV